MLVFATTCRGRVQHLRETLPRNLWENSEFKESRFVVLDYGSQDGLAEYLKTFRLPIDTGWLTVYQFPSATTFHMAHAKNMAHRCGILEGADILVNLDADNFTGPGFAQYVAEQFEKNGKDSFLWSRMIPGVLRRGISGRIAVTKTEFLNAGGYDERFSTYAPDDKDFNQRLNRMGYSPHEIDAKYLEAIHHGPKLRFREYPHAESELGKYELELTETSDTTVVNYGNIGCGTVYRNFAPEPIELAPLPTRIFGIGFQKTGTTSLAKAIEILGYDSAHWKNPRWARAIWDEMKETGKSLTLERSYALCDFPIAPLYKELDKAYPGSKFILTTRQEDQWLCSVRNHWDHSRNPYRASWDHDCFSHRMHREVYGRKSFDEAVFLARYRKHNAEVIEYFRNRPKDFLVVPLYLQTVVWKDICNFLSCPVPSVPYPREFVTKGGA